MRMRTVPKSKRVIILPGVKDEDDQNEANRGQRMEFDIQEPPVVEAVKYVIYT